jgi:hypothetical protein
MTELITFIMRLILNNAAHSVKSPLKMSVAW